MPPKRRQPGHEPWLAVRLLGHAWRLGGDILSGIAGLIVRDEKGIDAASNSGRGGPRPFSAEQLKPGEALYRVIFSSGAVLRRGVELSSAKVQDLVYGELVIAFEEPRGRRIPVRTCDGLQGWLSVSSADNTPILQLVTRKMPEGPLSIRLSNLSSERELPLSSARRERKWRDVHGEVEGVEAKPLRVRRSSPGMQLPRWRPGFDTKSPRVSASGSPEKEKARTASAPVPRLDAPPGSTSRRLETVGRTGDLILFDTETINVVLQQPEQPRKTAMVAAGEDLLDLNDGGLEVTSARGAVANSRIPSLADALREAPAATVSAHGDSSAAAGFDSLPSMAPPPVEIATSITQFSRGEAAAGASAAASIPREAPTRQNSLADAVAMGQGLGSGDDEFSFLNDIGDNHAEEDKDAWLHEIQSSRPGDAMEDLIEAADADWLAAVCAEVQQSQELQHKQENCSAPHGQNFGHGKDEPDRALEDLMNSEVGLLTKSTAPHTEEASTISSLGLRMPLSTESLLQDAISSHAANEDKEFATEKDSTLSLLDELDGGASDKEDEESKSFGAVVFDTDDRFKKRLARNRLVSRPSVRSHVNDNVGPLDLEESLGDSHFDDSRR